MTTRNSQAAVKYATIDPTSLRAMVEDVIKDLLTQSLVGKNSLGGLPDLSAIASNILQQKGKCLHVLNF